MTTAQKTRSVLAGKNFDLEILEQKRKVASESAATSIRALTRKVEKLGVDFDEAATARRRLERVVAAQASEIKRLRGVK